MVGATAPCSIFFSLSDNFKKSPLNIRLLWFTCIIPYHAGMHECTGGMNGNLEIYMNKEKNGKSMEIFQEV